MGIFKRLRQKRRARRAACDKAGHGARSGVRGAVRRVDTSTRRLRHRRESSTRPSRTDRPGERIVKREELLVQIGVFHRTVDSQRQTIGCFRRALDAQRSTIRALESHTKANARCDQHSRSRELYLRAVFAAQDHHGERCHHQRAASVAGAASRNNRSEEPRGESAALAHWSRPCGGRLAPALWPLGPPWCGPAARR